jgi:hypothetical protein
MDVIRIHRIDVKAILIVMFVLIALVASIVMMMVKHAVFVNNQK